MKSLQLLVIMVPVNQYLWILWQECIMNLRVVLPIMVKISKIIEVKSVLILVAYISHILEIY